MTIFYPRDRRLCVVGSWFGKRYSDNSRYLFEYLSENKEKYGISDVIWVTKSRCIRDQLRHNGKKVVLINSFLSWYYHLRAKYFFYDQSSHDIDYQLSHGGVRVNLWHGVPLKKIGHYRHDFQDEPVTSIENFRRAVKSIFKQKEFILSPSVYISDVMKTAFRKSVIIGPYPRNLYLNGKISSDLSFDESCLVKKIKKSGLKPIFYLPTFRDNSDFRFFGLTSKREVEDVVNVLQDKGFLLITKLHFSENKGGFLPDKIINIPADIDVYPLLKHSEILITDYSSIYFDYLYLDREIIFYPYDLEYYKHEDRGLIFDYDEFTPGVKVTCLSEFYNAIDRFANGKLDYQFDRIRLRNMIFDNNDMDSFLRRVFCER
ncbi:CDP-glycerol glycerophosphotransferase family protein [Vibrio alfacsensis]|uniref:CDP-glycerol glycerophosphotransferase family protein n=1 Tax=Vibrio alfacsensis TaxID=1074311 RepID=UPI004067CDBA